MAAGFSKVYRPPAFEYRGVFTNDEDLLGYFRHDPRRSARALPFCCTRLSL